jgi:predicted N-acetyltransferase YhbS
VAVVGSPRPLSRTDNREQFDCGRLSLNTWLVRHALANHESGASRVSVSVDAANGRLAGYVALSAAQISRSFLPKALQRNSPDPVPVTLLGQLAVDLAYQGQGLASSMLIYALRAALLASGRVGSVGVITHPIDGSVRTFYAKCGFEDLPQDPGGTMLLRMEMLRKSIGGT